MRLWVDPPRGWFYGFPKIWDSDKEPDIFKWLVENKYPQFQIDKLGDSFYTRQWKVND